MPLSTSKARVRSLYKILFKHHGPQRWWPAKTRWEMMVGAILTQNTSWTNVEKAIASLRAAGSLSRKAIAGMPRAKLARLIRSSGYFRQKAERLQRFARALDVDPLLARQRERLLAQHGIGPETADAILLYASGIPVFVVDAYTRRIGQRLGLFDTDDYHQIQQFFERHLPKTAGLYNEYHALLVRHAKAYCTSRAPRCGPCPLQAECAYGKGVRL